MDCRLLMLKPVGVGLINSWGWAGMHDESDKQKIAQSFGQAAVTYHRNASLQQDCAVQLLEILAEWSPELPLGTVLEVGCGTGFLTQGLSDRFPHHPLQVTDLSADMLQFCQAHLQLESRRAPVSFQQMDGENITGTYALIVASFVIQWFQQPVVSLRHWLERLEPNGALCLAFPTCHSFPEWKRACEDLQIPFTANSLPDPQMLIQELSSSIQKYSLKEVTVTTTHCDASEFFRALKSIGAGFNTSGQKLSLVQMKKLIQYWDRDLERSGVLQVQHHVAFLLIQ
jgi:malonyl-CoA O-methyltransferase